MELSGNRTGVFLQIKSNPPICSSYPVSLLNKNIHLLKVDDGKDVIDEGTLQFKVDWSVGRHGGTAVDFDKPGLNLAVEKNVESVKFKAMFVLNDDLLNALKSLDYYLLNLEKPLVHLLAAVLLDEVEFEGVQHPLAPQFLVVVV